MSHEPDRERIRLLREEQLAARHPGDSKIKGYNWDKHFEKKRRVDAQRKREAERPLVIALWDALPPRWKGFGYELFLGTIIGVILLFLVPPDIRIVFLVPQFTGTAVGMTLGAALQNDVKIQ